MFTVRLRKAFSCFIPKTLFGRMFWSILLLSLLVLLFTGGWFYHRSFQMMDAEAETRLLAGVKLLAHDLMALRDREDLAACNRLLIRRFGAGQTLGWIQNVYWLDLREAKSVFLASFSVESDSRSSLLAPTLEDVEDLIDDGINRLDMGRSVFPDPFAQTEGRRFKIVLFPLLDREGFLESVVGLEADMEYLDLSISIRQTASRAVVFAVPLCVIVSLLWARSFPQRIRELLEDLDRVARQEPVPTADLGIRELDFLRRGLADLGGRIEQRNRHIQDVHEEKLQELSLLGGAIAHEIRNPLSAMELHLGLVKRQLGPESAANDSIAEIQEQMIAMKKLVERFLIFSRRVTPERECFSLKTLCFHALETIAKAGHAIETKQEILDDLVVFVDGTMFGQVLENILNNAVSARPKGLVIEIKAERSAGMVRVSLSDNGPGVAPGLESRLFTPFVTGRSDGFGIGLALSRKLIEAHNGLLRYQHAPNGGACFIIEIPEKV